MMPSKFHTPEPFDEHIGVAVPSDLKAKGSQIAARQRIPASQLIREVLQNYTSAQYAA